MKYIEINILNNINIKSNYLVNIYNKNNLIYSNYTSNKIKIYLNNNEVYKVIINNNYVYLIYINNKVNKINLTLCNNKTKSKIFKLIDIDYNIPISKGEISLWNTQ